jgi:hypothetical protein
MAIAFAGAATVVNDVPGTSMTINKPTGTTAGNLLIAALTWSSGEVAISAAPAGWTSLRLTTSGGSNQISLHTYWKYASAGEGASWTWNLNGTGIQNCGAVWRVTGAHSTSAVDASGGGYGQGSAVSASSLTSNYNDALVCCFAGVSMDRAGVAFTVPSGFAIHNTLYAGASSFAGFSKIQAGSGSTGAVVTSVGAADAADYWAAQLVSLRPPEPSVEDRPTGHMQVPHTMAPFRRQRYPISYTAFLNKDAAASTLTPATLIQHWELATQHLRRAPKKSTRTHAFVAAAPLAEGLTTPVPPAHTDTGQMPPRGGIVPPNPGTDDAQWKRQASAWMLAANQGHIQNTGIITLEANATTTVVLDERVGPNSYIDFMPRTSNGAAELAAGTMYVSSQSNGQFVITHAFSVQTDRTFVFSILG